MNRRTHLELKRNVISSSFQTWAPSFFVLSFLEIPKNFLVILKSKPDTHAYRFVDQLLKNILLSSFRDDRIEHFKKIFLLVKGYLKNIFSSRSQLFNLFLHFVKHRGTNYEASEGVLSSLFSQKKINFSTTTKQINDLRNHPLSMGRLFINNSVHTR